MKIKSFILLLSAVVIGCSQAKFEVRVADETVDRFVEKTVSELKTNLYMPGEYDGVGNVAASIGSVFGAVGLYLWRKRSIGSKS